MDINKTMEAALTSRLKQNYGQQTFYLGMAFWFKKEGWNGFASWLFKQADEERGHALDMADYLIARGGVPTMSAIPAVKNDWTDAKEVFEAVLKHEQHVTELINELADVADAEKDRASQNFVAKYIDEQVEEEKNVKDILLLFKQMPLHTLAHIDRKVGERE